MKTFCNTDWDAIINRIKHLNIKTLEESYARHDKIVNIRHDVDDDLDASVEMALSEMEQGIASTYFILDTAPYWESPSFNMMISEIYAAGHNIGWHNNAISNHLRSSKPLEDCISEPLKKLREICPVIGTASHGDPLCHAGGYLNYYAFGFEEHENFPYTEIGGDYFALSYFGLEYEAYFTGHTHYLSDAGGAWNHDPDKYISDFEKNGKKLIINIHPQWWKL